jgi:hypothetical protein
LAATAWGRGKRPEMGESRRAALAISGARDFLKFHRALRLTFTGQPDSLGADFQALVACRLSHTRLNHALAPERSGSLAKLTASAVRANSLEAAPQINPNAQASLATQGQTRPRGSEPRDLRVRASPRVCRPTRESASSPRIGARQNRSWPTVPSSALPRRPDTEEVQLLLILSFERSPLLRGK